MGGEGSARRVQAMGWLRTGSQGEGGGGQQAWRRPQGRPGYHCWQAPPPPTLHHHPTAPPRPAPRTHETQVHGQHGAAHVLDRKWNAEGVHPPEAGARLRPKGGRGGLRSARMVRGWDGAALAGRLRPAARRPCHSLGHGAARPRSAGGGCPAAVPSTAPEQRHRSAPPPPPFFAAAPAPPPPWQTCQSRQRPSR